MKKMGLVLLMVLGVAAMSLADIKLSAQAQVDYKLKFNTNSSLTDYNYWGFNWAGLTLEGDLADNIYANFTADFSTGSAYMWYAYMDLSLSDMLVISAGLMDSIFAVATIQGLYAPMNDYGVKVSGNIVPNFLDYAVQLVDGNLSYVNNFTSISRDVNYLPAVQANLNFSLIKGLSVGAGARWDNFFSTYGIFTSTNTQLAFEGIVNITKDLIPNLSAMIDFVYCMDTVNYAVGVNARSTNLAGMYFFAKASYSLGKVIPAVLFATYDPDMEASTTNDANTIVTLQAKMLLDEAGNVSVTPRIDYWLMKGNNSTLADALTFRVRFDYLFDTTIYKAPETENKEMK